MDKERGRGKIKEKQPSITESELFVEEWMMD